MRRHGFIGKALSALADTLLAAGVASAQVSLNGQAVAYQERPFTIGNFLMLPLAETLGFVGGQLGSFDPTTGEARFSYKDNQASIHVGSGYATVNGDQVVMGVPAVIRGGRIFVPAIFLRQQLGLAVDVSPNFVQPGVRTIVLGLRQAPDTIYEPGEIAIGGVRILNLTTPGTYSSIEQRAGDVTERMNLGIQSAQRLDHGRFRVSRITLGSLNGMPTIFIAGVPFVSVMPEDAAAVGMDQDSLARTWLGRVQSAFRLTFPRG